MEEKRMTHKIQTTPRQKGVKDGYKHASPTSFNLIKYLIIIIIIGETQWMRNNLHFDYKILGYLPSLREYEALLLASDY